LKGINPLLYGLNDLYGKSGMFQGFSQTPNAIASLIGTGRSGMNISTQAKGISELYTMVKAGKDKNAAAGFNQTVKNLFKDTDSTSLQDFVTFGMASVVSGKRETFGKMLGCVNKLNTKAGAGLGISIVRQAVNTYEEKGTALAGKFIDTAANIMDRKFSNSAEMTSTLKDFVSTWNAVLTQTKTSKDILDLNTFAQKAKSLDNDALKTYLEQVNAAIKKTSAASR